MPEKSNDWPAAAVAIAILILIGAVTVSAIRRYESLNEALQIWQASGTIIGMVTGAFVTFFFTRGAVEAAQSQARNTMQMAAQEERLADATHRALTKAVGLIPAAIRGVASGPRLLRRHVVGRRHERLWQYHGASGERGGRQLTH